MAHEFALATSDAMRLSEQHFVQCVVKDVDTPHRRAMHHKRRWQHRCNGLSRLTTMAIVRPNARSKPSGMLLTLKSNCGGQLKLKHYSPAGLVQHLTCIDIGGVALDCTA